MKAQKFIPLVVVAAGLLAYHNSFTGGFISDDLHSIPENLTIRHLWPIWPTLSPPPRGGITVEGRPLINLSLAVNYALGGYNVWGYHALNLVIHILAGLALLGIVRRTLLQPPLRARFGAAANELALATAVLWTVHPLQTESVTYMIQRAESLMGLFYLLTLYCFIRATESQRVNLWYGLCIAACALGMATKEVMVSAPLMVMLYDRAFLCESFRDAWRRRRPLYLGLSATWILLGVVMAQGSTFVNASINAHNIGVTRWEYFWTEPGVILQYLRLSVWPSSLCLDRGWPIARTCGSILPPAIAVGVLLGASIWAWRTNPVWGFMGAWFFLILAPSSSIIPTQDTIHEHRMYLPLAVVISLVVVGLYSLLRRRSFAVFVVLGIGLGLLTWRRNQDYRDELTIRTDAVAKFPHDAVVHHNLGVTLASLGRAREAIEQYEQAVRLNPDDARARYNLGVALVGVGRVPEAIEQYEQAIRIRPDYPEPHNNLGVILAQSGKPQEAIGHFEQVLRARSNNADAHNNLGAALAQAGRLQEATEQLDQVVRMNPADPEAHYNLGLVLEQTGRANDAVEQYELALRLRPNYPEAQNNLARLLAKSPGGGAP
ncbi:MAG TPA: tetratricopeptide repeat protein [Verrucomicrobiae bacterium]|nr:tetratricopeptide repeat protein [Verrucomicrobiae bacterium]